MSVRPSRPHRLAAAALAGVTAFVLVPPPVPVAAAGFPFRVSTAIWGCRADLSNIPWTDGTVVTVRVRQADGTLKGTTVAEVTDSQAVATWTVPGKTACALAIVPGDRIVARVNSSSRRTFTVPDVVPRADPVADVVRGPATSLPGTIQTLMLELHTGPWASENADVTSTIVAHADGSWAVLLPDIGGRGLAVGDVVSVDWMGDALDHVTAWLPVAGMTARVGKAKVTGTGRRGQTVRVTLLAATGAVRASGSTTVTRPHNAWSVTLRRNGAKVSVRPGDRLVSTVVSDASLTVVDPALTLSASTGRLTGRCPAGGWGAAWYASGDASGQMRLTLDGQGRFQADDLAGLRPFAPGTYVEVACHNAIGMEIRDRAVPG